ncbi:MAG: hypothetical protein H0X27_11990 [Caulobacteraceae bacterium]|nr:hypothetical protein [Caulobacteraceae bacterium]
MAENPLRGEMREWLPEFDFGVMSHGFAPHGRDYVFILQAAGTYELTLTHVVELNYQTRVRDDVWPISWNDTLIDYSRWEAEGSPDGYVWGTNWSLADPGLDAPNDDRVASKWSERLGLPMYAMSVETDRFRLSMVFHEARSTKLSDDASVVSRVLNPLSRP